MYQNQQMQSTSGATGAMAHENNQNAMRGGEQSNFNGGTNSAAGNYMTIGAVGQDKSNNSMPGSALAQRSAQRG